MERAAPPVGERAPTWWELRPGIVDLTKVTIGFRTAQECPAMPHTTVPATTAARSGRPASTTSATSRRTPAAAIPVMPLWQGLAHLFAPADTAAGR